MHRPVAFGTLMAAGIGMVVLAVSPATNANYSDTVKVPITITVQVPSTDGPIDPPTPSETPNGLSKAKQTTRPRDDTPKTEASATPAPQVSETPAPIVTSTPDSVDMSTEKVSTNEVTP